MSLPLLFLQSFFQAAKKSRHCYLTRSIWAWHAYFGCRMDEQSWPGCAAMAREKTKKTEARQVV